MAKRKLTELYLTEREMDILDEALEILYQDACEDADEGRAEEIAALGDELKQARA